jgi:hypothetical protein
VNGRAGRAATLALVAAGTLAPLLLHWAAGRTLAWFDTQRLYAPQRWLVDEALRSLRLPLWDPHMGGGVPFLADAIHGVLHPLSIAVAWLGSGRSVDLLLGGHVLAAGLGAAFLARELGGSRAGAALAAFAYAGSGYVLSMAGNLVFIAGAGSLPWCVAGLRRFGAGPGPGSLALAALGAAVLAFSGDAQGLVLGGLLGLALAVEAAGWRGGLRAGSAGALGLLVAAVQLVTTAVHVPRTVRAAGSWTPTPDVWAFEPWRLVELVAPGLVWGRDPYADPVYAGLAGPGHWPASDYPMPFAASVFIGLVPLALAVAGLREGRRGKVLGLLALLALWVGLGTTLGADALLGRLPIWSSFRHAEKLVGPLCLVVAVLAALGLDAVTARRVGGRALLGAAAALGLAGTVGGRIVVGGLPAEVVGEGIARIHRGTWHVAVAAGALALWLLLRDRLGPAREGAALASVAWAAALAASPAALHPGDPEARLRAPGPALVAPPPGPRIYTPYFHDLVSDDPAIDSGDLAAREHASLGYPAYNVRARLDSLDEYSAMAPSRLLTLGNDRWSHWALGPRRYAVTHLVLDRPVTPSDLAQYAVVTGSGARLVGVADGHELWAVPHREWASFAPAVSAVPGGDEALAATARAFVSGDPAVVVEAEGSLSAAAGRVLALRREAEALWVDAEAEADGTLVIADAWWPGWEATIDGRAIPILRADALVRAVRWPAGRHRLEMRYRPPEVRAGLALSAAGVAALGAGVLLLGRRARRRAPSPV